MKVIEGQVEDLDRSTQVSGTENGTSTTHIAIFKIGENRVLLSSNTPPMIANDDIVRIAGIDKPGQFGAIACKNLSTGWISSYNKSGCGVFVLFCMTLFTLLISFLFYPFFIMTVVFSLILFKVLSANGTLKKAHSLVNY